MRMSEKYRNNIKHNNKFSVYHLIPRRVNGGNNLCPSPNTANYQPLNLKKWV